MATKVPNEFINKILESKKYFSIDTLLGLCFISCESLDKKSYIIKTEDFSITSLAEKLQGKYIKASLRTIVSNIKDLISLKILNKNINNNEWTLAKMEEMNKKGSRASKFYKEDGFIINLLNLKNSIWSKALRSDNKYYGRKIIKKFIENNFIEKIQESSIYDTAPKKIKNFCISFKCSLFVKVQRKITENEDADFIIVLNKEEHNLLKDIIDFYKNSGKEIFLSNTELMHIIHAISPLNWNLKYTVAKEIIAKFVSIRYYKDSQEINSLPNYLKGIISNIIEREKQAYQ